MRIAISGKGSNEKALLKNFLALMSEKSKTELILDDLAVPLDEISERAWIRNAIKRPQKKGGRNKPLALSRIGVITFSPF